MKKILKNRVQKFQLLLLLFFFAKMSISSKESWNSKEFSLYSEKDALNYFLLEGEKNVFYQMVKMELT